MDDLKKLSGLIDAPVYIKEVTGSTNDDLKRLAAEGVPDGALLCADCQTAGKGRLNKSFFSPAGCGIYMSVYLKRYDPRLTCCAAVAVSGAIEALCGIRTGIKWVNDVYYENKKICGILTEAVNSNGKIVGAVVGIGVNLLNGGIPDELKNKVGYLYEREPPVGRAELAAEIYRRLISFSDLSGEGAKNMMRQYRNRSIVIGKTVRVELPNETYFAEAEDIADDGALILIKDGKTIRLTAGSISLNL